jgi:PKD repeat protein
MKNKLLFWLLLLCSTQLFSQGPILNNNMFSNEIRICLNSTVTSIGAYGASGGNGTINYKWISSNLSETIGFADAAGINNGQYYTPPSPFTDTVWYRRVVTSGTYVDTSNVFVVIVLTKFANIQQYFPSTGIPLCEGNAMSFSDASLLGSSSFIQRKWIIDSSADFSTNDYFNSSLNNLFSSPGNYNVKLVVNYTGCTDSITKVITILPKPKAKIGIWGNSMQFLGTNSFNFIDSSSYTGGNYSRKWSFSNKPNDSSIIVNPIKTYDSIGSYIVKLKVTGSNGCYTSAVKQIDVIKSITNNLITGNQTICSGETPAALTGTIPTGTNSGILKEDFTGQVYNEWWGSDLMWIPEDHGWNSSERIWQANIPSTNDFGGFIDTRMRVSGRLTRSFLTTKIFTPSNLGDSLRFDVSTVMNCPYQGECLNYDSLIIHASNGSAFKRIKGWVTSLTVDTLIGGVTTKNAFYYGCNRCVYGTSYGTWARKRLALPLGTTQVKFEFYSTKTTDANGFNIDNVVIDSSTSKIIEYKWLVSTSSATSGFALANGINNGQNYFPQNLTQTSWFKRVVLNNIFSDTSAAVKVNVIPASFNFFVNNV